MWFPLFLTLLPHVRPQPPAKKLLPVQVVPRAAPVPIKVPETIQYVLLAAPLPRQGAPSAQPPSRLTPQLIPLRVSLRLDTAPASPSLEEADLLAAVNAARAEQGLDALVPNPLLTDTARAHSREMARLNYFSHESPTRALHTPLSRYLAAVHSVGLGTPRKALVGENIFYASATTPVYNASYAHQALMHSPSHRANILEPRFNEVGIGLYRDSRGEFWITELFARE